MTIERVAIVHNGIIYSLPRPNRHHDVIRLIHNETGAMNIRGEQGFITSDSRFVAREPAKVIASAAGQLLSRASDLPELFSEDLW